MECIIFLESTKFQECVWSAWILVCKWSPGSAFGVRTFQQKKMWECIGVRRSALKDSRVRLECALLTHFYALQTHFSTARAEVFLLVLLCDGWRVLPADFQVYPPIWRVGGRLANTLVSCGIYLITISQVLMILVTKMSLSVQSRAIMTLSTITLYSKQHCGYWGRTSEFDLTKDTHLVEIDLVIMVPHGKWWRAYWYCSSPILVLSCIVITCAGLDILPRWNCA